MASLLDTSSRSRAALGFGLAAAVLGAITVVRLIGLRFSTVDLFIDESQYWAWSRELAFGYYTKPPLLAWIIAAAEPICGSSEACIRAPAPILYFGTSLLVYAIARQLYDQRTAFFAALSIMLAPGAIFSARIISTDVPLLFCWALAVLAYVKMLAGGGTRWTMLLGLALGLGLLAKYAMIYFVLGVALAAWLETDARRLLRTPAPWLALAIAALVVAPNLLWNIDNGLATFRHTGGNIEGRGLELNPLRAFEFIAAQFGVAGPVVFAVLLAAIVRIASPVINRADRLMLAFAIPPLVLITGLGFFTRSLANWAAPSYITATVVVVALLARRNAWTWIALSLGIGAVGQVALLAGDVFATRLHVPLLANGDVYHRTLGGHALGLKAGELARQAGARTIVGDQRGNVASLLYYWRDQPEPVLAWQTSDLPDDQFQLTRALTDQTPAPILFVSHCGATQRLTAYFATVELVATFDVPTGPTTQIAYSAFKLDGRKRPIGPLGACM